MPDHSSHLLQPLDVGCFGPLKREYSELVEAKMRLGFNHVDKLDSLQVYPAAHQQVLAIQNIQSGFQAAGILLINLKEMLMELNIQITTPRPFKDLLEYDRKKPFLIPTLASMSKDSAVHCLAPSAVRRCNHRGIIRTRAGSWIMQTNHAIPPP
jgi:hypothetical protein